MIWLDDLLDSICRDCGITRAQFLGRQQGGAVFAARLGFYDAASRAGYAHRQIADHLQFDPSTVRRGLRLIAVYNSGADGRIGRVGLIPDATGCRPAVLAVGRPAPDHPAHPGDCKR